MKMKYVLLLKVLLVSVCLTAQEITITGNVTDQNGAPLPGVSVLVLGTTNGTQTDFDGNYTLNTEQGVTLQFSYIGQRSVEKIVDSSTTLNVVMEEDAQALEEVVVTALGISREKKSLGYATTELEGDEVNVAGETNVINSLSGKAAGVNITRNNNIGGSTNVIIRGITSINGDNQALFVLDGVPLNNNLGNLSGVASGGEGMIMETPFPISILPSLNL